MASTNEITPIHMSIITLVITAEFSADPLAFIRPSTIDALAAAAPSVFTLNPIHTPAAVLCVGKKYAPTNGINMISTAEKITIIEEIAVEYIAGASIAEAVAIDAETPHTPTPEERVAAKFLSRPILLEMRKAIIHTTGNERKTASNILGALVTKVVNNMVYLVIILSANNNTLVFAQKIKTASENMHIPSNNTTSSAITHHFALVNGIRLHYVIAGHGKPVVLLHGWPETWYEWRHIIPSLAKNNTVIAPDLPGLGDSSKPVSGYDGKTVADDIYKLVT